MTRHSFCNTLTIAGELYCGFLITLLIINRHQTSYLSGRLDVSSSDVDSWGLMGGIFYSMSIVGTLCFPDEESDVINDADAFFEAITEIQPTVFFGPPSAYERIYHHFR